MPEKVIYTAKTHTTGGRDKGLARSSDGRLDVHLSPPGTAGSGTNPEQLFAAGWSACFEGALAFVARRRGLALSEETAIDAEVDLMTGDGGFHLRARLAVSIPGLDPATAQTLVDEAHATCPYSKAIRGNVEVAISVVSA